MNTARTCTNLLSWLHKTIRNTPTYILFTMKQINRKTGFIYAITSSDGLLKRWRGTDWTIYEQRKIARFLVLTAIHVHCPLSNRILHSIPTVSENIKQTNKQTSKEINRRGGREREQLNIIVIPVMIVDRVGYWYELAKKRANRQQQQQQNKRVSNDDLAHSNEYFRHCNHSF